MSRSSRMAVVKSDLSESLNCRLNSYALAAGAAGVAMLTVAVPAEARIVNEHISFPLSGNSSYDFNPANQSVAPFVFVGTFIDRASAWWNRAFFQPNSAGASVLQAASGLPAELVASSLIGPSRNWGKGASYGLLFTYGPYGGGTRSHHRGKFGKPGFVGFRFTVSGKQHYGWIRLRISVHAGPNGTQQTTTEIVDCAFETIPGKAIRAGQTKEADEPAPSSTRPEASGTPATGVEVSSDAPHLASLGTLALGALGIPLWRPK